MARLRIRSNEPHLSEQGYQFQWHWMRVLLRRFEKTPSITIRDAYGNPITHGNLAERGADGGIDAIFEITAKTPAAAKRIETQVLKFMDEQIAK